MAHEIDMSNGRANMAYTTTGKTPWHGLGHAIDADASIEDWRAAAGLEWSIKRAPVSFAIDDQEWVREYNERSVLYRSDTQAPLSVVSDGYQEVQPEEILEFFRDVVSRQGFKMHTAGSLKGGRKVWALASIGEEAEIVRGNEIGGYLLLATSCDGSLATTAKYTSIEVVCNNTLSYATATNEGDGRQVKVYHGSKFNAAAVQRTLGLETSSKSWTAFIEQARLMATVSLSDKQAVTILHNTLADDEQQKMSAQQYIEKSAAPRQILDLFNGAGIGADLRGQTAWGLVAATTQYFDHEKRSRTGNDGRLHDAWFGGGSTRKQAVWDACADLVAA